MRKLLLLLPVLFVLIGCEKPESEISQLTLIQADIGGQEISLSEPYTQDLPIDRPITLHFSGSIDPASVANNITLFEGNQTVNISTSLIADNKTIIVYPSGVLKTNTWYKLVISETLSGMNRGVFAGKDFSFRTILGALQGTLEIADAQLTKTGRIVEVPLSFKATLQFSNPVNRNTLPAAIRLTGTNSPGLQFSYSEEDSKVEITTSAPLQYLTKYNLNIANSLKGAEGEDFAGLNRTFFTEIDPDPKFPKISEEALMNLVQEQTFKYFWDFAHPNSGLARERNTSGNLVTIGGSGFGVMTILVGIERGFISRQDGVERLEKIVNFLGSADRFHGVWPHWLNGNTGLVIPFSQRDNGGDLVETAFMIQGLLTAKVYLNESNPQEKSIQEKITQIWHEVEWNWFTRGGQNVLYWHWSPEYNWEMNLRILGWNESLIIYVLAASSPTHAVEKPVYDNGWARNGAMRNGNTYYGIYLPLGYEFGGPLFFAHYSFLGLDPRNLIDQYANYWEQNRNHTLINQAHAVQNPLGFVGYSEDSWGFTASDNHLGYNAHSPTNDMGVITPTAALSSFPYTPEASMKALEFFYYQMGDRLWGEYGFYDAFNVTEEWYASSYLAIDQGPIILMIENHRSALLWDLFMQDPDVKAGLEKLNFNY
ncbi:glucoamylase family protein [Aquiflexum sp.]|uniref:glucoamylase family protein n=1 Tax=Aquiflexum sp. TaxID=1872584 RepID=UPI003593160C